MENKQAKTFTLWLHCKQQASPGGPVNQAITSCPLPQAALTRTCQTPPPQYSRMGDGQQQLQLLHCGRRKWMEESVWRHEALDFPKFGAVRNWVAAAVWRSLLSVSEQGFEDTLVLRTQCKRKNNLLRPATPPPLTHEHIHRRKPDISHTYHAHGGVGLPGAADCHGDLASFRADTEVLHLVKRHALQCPSPTPRPS